MFGQWMGENKIVLNKENGCWLMFYDYKKSTVVIPMK